MPNANPQAKNFNSSLTNYFQAFDIIDHAKKTKIQMFEVEYLQVYPKQLDRLTKFVKESQPTQPHLALPESKGMPNNLVTIPSSVLGKVEPFYLSLVINGFKLSNCIIDFGASDNVMPAKVADAFGLTLTKSFGNCYSMENKQVPLKGQIKDAQFSSTSFPDKKIKMTVLVADVCASYGMLLCRNLCKDVGGELNMDMTEAIITVKGVMQCCIPRDKQSMRWSKLMIHMLIFFLNQLE